MTWRPHYSRQTRFEDRHVIAEYQAGRLPLQCLLPHQAIAVLYAKKLTINEMATKLRLSRRFIRKNLGRSVLRCQL